MDKQDWDRRVAEAWTQLDHLPEEDFRALIDRLAAELPSDDGDASFERAAAYDSTGHPGHAVPLYREALAKGTTGERRRRTVIQLASSLRNLGHPEESIALLTPELTAPSDHLDDAIRAFLALALADTGQEREALTLSLTALAPHLPRYQRSLTNYAHLLTHSTPPA
ncbi:tetratricopeptide repeat protein [Sphaerisporangium aureirubrum]|uniref:Tetratricopeptide repeat protein n=1 Tax=Sphaerisporangium aureirubrum TaxID=1544736 RepID=A0ABW1NT88_9ACTN